MITFQLKNDINDVLTEFNLPEFVLLPEIKTVRSMVNKIVQGYHKEVRIQAIWGGIRNPAAVLQNKIRHELTNYDEVRDALTEALNTNLIDKLMFIDIREELINMSYQMCDTIINFLPKKITINFIEITSKQLRKANENHWRREINSIKKSNIYHFHHETHRLV